VLLALIHQRIDDPLVLDLVGRYLHTTVDENCLYTTVTRGIRLALNGAQNSTALAGLNAEGRVPVDFVLIRKVPK
jgi:hypothetical protein